MNRTVRILSLLAITLWLLAVVVAFVVPALLGDPGWSLRASIPLFGPSLLIASAAWLFGLVDAARADRWGWFFGILLPALAVVGGSLLGLDVMRTMRGHEATVAALLIAALLTPLVAMMYSLADTAPDDGKAPALPRGLSTVQELLRPAEWDHLSQAQRDALLASYTGVALPIVSDGPTVIDHTADEDTQDWVAQLVAMRFQKEAASIIQSWLTDAAPNAHLLVHGARGYGMTSLVTSLAHRAMAQLPAPPDMCTVPDPSALDRAELLTLPAGTGEAFSHALRVALSQICENWGAVEEESENERARIRHVKEQVGYFLAPVVAIAPEPARTYVIRLQEALEELAETGDAPPFCDWEDVAACVGAWRGNLDCASSTSRQAAEVNHARSSLGAPVIVFARAKMDMAAALKCANGGVLVIPSSDLVIEGRSSDDAGSLLTALRRGALPGESGSPPIPISVRVALMVTGESINGLVDAADDFFRLFRYEVLPDGVTDWTPEAEAVYATLADGVARRYHLPPFDTSGVARLVEEGARRVGEGHAGFARSRLITHLLTLHDLAVEAGQAARLRNAQATLGADVEAVIRRRLTDYGVDARRMRHSILSGRDIVPTAGAMVGQINGLGVNLTDPFEASYSVPSRLSVIVGPGREERLIDVEREANAADSTHIMGALTMTGYLAGRYGRVQPISTVVRTRFEQSYFESGPSASAGELIALLSALAEVPIFSSLAVTGAVGQYGEIQAIGGVNHKIEGFWEIVHKRRCLGEKPECPHGYGVLIPAANAQDLMLRPEVAESIAHDGWFHVWPISTVDEALPLLMDKSAEEIHQRVERQLQRFYRLATKGRARG
jgi:AAA domain/Lon protease (S16) C-terminal proteolytic domain